MVTMKQNDKVVEGEINGLDQNNSNHAEIFSAFKKFCEFYNLVYSVAPQFYVTRDGDSSSSFHIDISTSNPDRGVSSPIYVLYHFWYWLKHNNALPGWTVAISAHIRHLHFNKGTKEPIGYFVERKNTDSTIPFDYVFDKTDKAVIDMASYYSAHELRGLDDVQPQKPGLDLGKFKWIIVILIILAIAYFAYDRFFKHGGENAVYGYD